MENKEENEEKLRRFNKKERISEGKKRGKNYKFNLMNKFSFSNSTNTGFEDDWTTELDGGDDWPEFLKKNKSS